MNLNIPEIDYTCWGWVRENNVLQPLWMTIPEASKSCRELKRCGCKTLQFIKVHLSKIWIKLHTCACDGTCYDNSSVWKDTWFHSAILCSSCKYTLRDDMIFTIYWCAMIMFTNSCKGYNLSRYFYLIDIQYTKSRLSVILIICLTQTCQHYHSKSIDGRI